MAMPEHDLEKLLGGFSADQLTPEEKTRLYSAALHDQQLFDALADEQALKELLADPAVRHRLLDTLNQARAAGRADTVTWIDWLRRPSGLAWAGGLAATMIAAVLGSRIYQDSLKHAAQSVTTEDTRPAAPSVQAPSLSQPESSSLHDLPVQTQSLEPPAENVVKNTLPLDQVMKREQVPASHEQRASDTITGLEKRYREQHSQSSNTTPLSDTLEKATTNSGALPRQKQVPNTPAASALTRPPLQTPSGAMEAATTVPTISARARFFGNTAPGTTSGMREAEQEQPLKLLAESAPQAGKAEQRDTQVFEQGPVPEAVSSIKPLGLRYSFMIQGADGRNREVSPSIASGHNGPILLTVESNQEVYLQLWMTTESRPPQLLFPRKDGGQAELKLFGGRRQSVLLPIASKPITIIARLSRISLAPTLDQDPSPMARRTRDPLQELVTTSEEAPHQEEATYVVNQDASLNQLTVSISFPIP